jgi:hypothetical protein
LSDRRVVHPQALLEWTSLGCLAAAVVAHRIPYPAARPLSAALGGLALLLFLGWVQTRVEDLCHGDTGSPRWVRALGWATATLAGVTLALVLERIPLPIAFVLVGGFAAPVLGIVAVSIGMRGPPSTRAKN